MAVVGELPAGGMVSTTRQILETAIEHQRAGRFRQAESLCLQILTSQPDSAHALHLLGLIAHQEGRQDVAVAFIRKAIKLKPRNQSFHSNLASALLRQGKQEEAVASFREAVDLDPDNPWVRSNLLLALQYSSSCDRQTLLTEAQAWGFHNTPPMAGDGQPFTNLIDANRTVRIGYVSSDFRRHPVGFFLHPVISGHDRSLFQVYCYSSHPQADDLTEQLRSRADAWRDVAHLDNAAVAELIRTDAIDILVDLAGHTGFNRLPVFALKPAPVQASWLGYADTTGLSRMDYFISDRFVCPEEEDGAFTEQVVRLPDAFLCYTPPEDAPEVSALPAFSRGHVTFGCFNNIAKITPDVIRLWAEILRALPEACIYLKTRSLGQPSVRSRYAALFAEQGVSSDRVTFEGASPRAEYLAAYGKVDVALDPFPFNGGTTTLDALWMGVPVVSFRGDRPVSRLGASHLSAAGCGDLAVMSSEEYVRKAIALASDISKLSDIRAGLRQRVLESPICDSPRFIRGLEAAYRAMWRRWCEQALPSC